MLELMHEPSAQKQAFKDACLWAEEIFLCFAWMEPGDAHGPSFADLEPHQSKVRQAIVGLAHCQSYPALLRRLHRSSVLRLVSTLDGSFSPNFYLFRSGTRVRVLVASAPFSSTRFARPCESMVVFEGEREDPFALRAFQLLDRCRTSAHVPTSSELDAYEEAWADLRSTGHMPAAIHGMALQSLETAGLGELQVCRATTDILDGFVQVRDSLAATAAVRIPARISAGGAASQERLFRTTLFWSALGSWSALRRTDSGYGLHFGFAKPWEVELPVATLSLSAQRTPPPLREVLGTKDDFMVMAGSPTGRRFLLHVGGEAADYTADTEVNDPSGTCPAGLIGEVGAPDFVQSATAFALRVSRRRAQRLLENVL